MQNGALIASFGYGARTPQQPVAVASLSKAITGICISTLVDNGLFTSAQLQTLGAVTPAISPAPVNQVNNPWLRTFDASLSYPIKLKWLGERASLEPSINVFNVFNFGYFTTLSGFLESTSSLGQSAAGTSSTAVNTTTGVEREALRVSDGSGTYEQGAPRAMEFSLKFNF